MDININETIKKKKDMGIYVIIDCLWSENGPWPTPREKERERERE